LRSQNLSATELAKRFRLAAIPVLGYLRDEYFWLDARTISDKEIKVIVEMLQKILENAL
jgi:seryl-tRNA(Sec) selenium transferase